MSLHRLWKRVLRAIRPVHRRLAYRLFALAERRVQARPRLAVFAGRGGRIYEGNPRHLFEYCLREGTLDPYWLTRDYRLHRRLRAQVGGRSLYLLTPRALLRFWQARFVFLAESATDISPYVLSPSRKVVINLWHGVAVKRVAFARDLAQAVPDPRRRERWEADMRSRYAAYSHVVVSSERERHIAAERFGMSPDRIWVTGLPRNDVLVHGASGGRPAELPAGRRIVLYAPTWRDRWGKAPVLPLPDLEPGDLVRVLEEHDAVLAIRPHQREERRMREEARPLLGATERVVFVGRDAAEDTNTLLVHVDVLVTDYSSIFVDFLLLDRPVVFVPHDYETYAGRRGFTWDYWADSPGRKAIGSAAFREALTEALTDPGAYAGERHRMVEHFHGFVDGKACERVIGRLRNTYLHPNAPDEH